ncbi:hypothetical protein MNBD_NITROSPIRAE01-1933 [hydrothermal vent metagenome]|uniref:Glucose/Sorbosone dehydrogenase domain-containing protein n=1 Tax=hydrothermal vent metagenome TaxID=652676 RepID=A0A3B1CRK0_9ZZZZ
MLRSRNICFNLFALMICIGIETACGKTPSATPKPSAGSEDTTIKIKLEQIVEGLDQPVGMKHDEDGSGRLFIVEQGGLIRILKDGTLANTPFLNIQSRVSSGYEEGLLGLAFHPNFKKNRRFFIHYTASGKTGIESRISEFMAEDNLKTAKIQNEKVLLRISQPFRNHNGGDLAFGPKGKLYIGMGDGGAGNDPQRNAQNLGSLLGKMLRIDVDQQNDAKTYGIPEDNPFRTQTRVAPEIWASGLRNPWRFSFDSETGDLYVGDVGQTGREEINLLKRGENYGWNIMEGTICTPRVDLPCDPSQYAAPIHDYPRGEGTVVIGGYVYRGKTIPRLTGAYIYGDFGNGRIWMLRHDGSTTIQHERLLESERPISAFAEDAEGELYVVDYRGELLKIVSE